jgi:hypothetical protein
VRLIELPGHCNRVISLFKYRHKPLSKSVCWLSSCLRLSFPAGCCNTCQKAVVAVCGPGGLPGTEAEPDGFWNLPGLNHGLVNSWTVGSSLRCPLQVEVHFASRTMTPSTTSKNCLRTCSEGARMHVEWGRVEQPQGVPVQGYFFFGGGGDIAFSRGAITRPC